MNGHTKRKALRLADIPELARPVGLHGLLGHAEVGGPVCFGIAIATVKLAV